MYLKDLDEKKKFAEFVTLIKEMGGAKKFFAAICLAGVKNKPGLYKCPISKKLINKNKAYMLTDSAGVPILRDRFIGETQADIAFRCLQALHFRYQQFLGPKNQEEASEDEIRDYFPMKDDEGTKAYLQRLQLHLEELEHKTPELGENERAEDHQ